MPTPTNWAAKADLSDEDLVKYKGLAKTLLQKLEAQGVDVAPYVAAQQANNALESGSMASTRERTRATFACEKRKLLQAMASYIGQKVAKGLKAAHADNAQALQLNKEQADDIAVAEAVQAAAPAALQWSKARNHAKLNMLQQQGQGLQDLPKHVGQFAMALATLSGTAPAPAEDDGDTQTPLPEQLPTPTPVPATTNAQPTLADRNLRGISLPLEPQKKKKQKVALLSPRQALAHLKIL